MGLFSFFLKEARAPVVPRVCLGADLGRPGLGLFWYRTGLACWALCSWQPPPAGHFVWEAASPRSLRVSTLSTSLPFFSFFLLVSRVPRRGTVLTKYFTTTTPTMHLRATMYVTPLYRNSQGIVRPCKENFEVLSPEHTDAFCLSRYWVSTLCINHFSFKFYGS